MRENQARKDAAHPRSPASVPEGPGDTHRRRGDGRRPGVAPGTAGAEPECPGPGAGDRSARPPAEHPAAARRLARLLDGPGWPRVAAALDLLVLVSAVLVTIAASDGHVASGDAAYLMLAFPCAGALALGLGRSQTHRLDAGVLDDLGPIVAAVSVAAMVTLAGSHLIDDGAAPQSTVVVAWLLSLVMLTLVHSIVGPLRRRLRRRGVSGRPTLIVGAGPVGVRVARWLDTRPQYGLRPVGFLDWDLSAPDRVRRHSIPLLGSPSDLERHVLDTGAQHVIVAFTDRPDHHLTPLIRASTQLDVEMSIVPRLFEHTHERMRYEPVGGLPLLAMGRSLALRRRMAAKHVLDRLVGGLLLVLASPLMAAIALAIYASSGRPVVFRQRRLGEGGGEFDLLKFCTMRGSSPDPAGLGDLGADDLAPGGVGDDDRRTLVGRLLRRSSLDELLQLVNVVRGEMSLVGPRPERPEYVELFSDRLDRYADRHRVRPGITGLAQVQGLRGRTSLADRIELDNYYIEHWSLTLDAKLLLRTVQAAFQVPE